MSSDCRPDPSNPLSLCNTRIGIAFIAQSACLSFIAVVSLLVYVSYIAFQNRHRAGWRFIRSHLDLYLLGLFCSDLIQAIGGIMDIKWIAIAGISEGRFCTAQGVLKQLGDVGVALCSLAIAVHTFAELALRWKEPASFTIPIVVLGLYAVFLILIVGVGYAAHRHSVYYGNTIYWCWIIRQYFSLEIGLEYLWLWISALISLGVYVPIFLVLKRVIIIERTDSLLRYHVRRTSKDERAMSPKSGDTVDPRQMLFYPAVYIITVVPHSIARLPTLRDPENRIPLAAVVFAGMLFSASGVFNVIVYTKTRPALLRPSALRSDPPRKSMQHVVPQLFLSDADQVDTDLPDQRLEDTTHESGDGPNPTPASVQKEEQYDMKGAEPEGLPR